MGACHRIRCSPRAERVWQSARGSGQRGCGKNRAHRRKNSGCPGKRGCRAASKRSEEGVVAPAFQHEHGGRNVVAVQLLQLLLHSGGGFPAVGGNQGPNAQSGGSRAWPVRAWYCRKIAGGGPSRMRSLKAGVPGVHWYSSRARIRASHPDSNSAVNSSPPPCSTPTPRSV